MLTLFESNVGSGSWGNPSSGGIATWNCQALFTFALRSGSGSCRKMATVRGLASEHQILLLQEVHGVWGDHVSLQALLPYHTVYANFGEHTGVGGTVILVASKLVKDAVQVQHDPWVKGRCQEVRLHYSDKVLSIINIHMEPAAHHNTKASILRTVAARAVHREEGLQIVGGDWDHMATGEHRFDVCRGVELPKTRASGSNL